MESFRTNGTCARQIIFEVENDEVKELRFVGGCSGNLQALARLCVGRKIDDIVELCAGIRCQNSTSCPDQLSKALLDYREKELTKK